jgi:glycosyltransferase involved in cell wall biosynthesis
VVFLGSMDWQANEDGVQHFVEKVWPRVRGTHPEARFTIVGRNPSAAVRRLAGTQGIEVTGTVPDVRPYLAEAAVVVVPLLVGGGTRIKIFEAMAMARPVVSTTLGAEGLPVVPGEHLVVEDEPKRFAAAVSQLLRDGSMASSLGERARALVCCNYTAETVAAQFDTICRRTVEEWCARHSTRAADDSYASEVSSAGF